MSTTASQIVSHYRLLERVRKHPEDIYTRSLLDSLRDHPEFIRMFGKVEG